MMEFDRYRPFRNMCTGTSSGHIQRFSAHSDSLVSSRAKIELFRRATFSLSPPRHLVILLDTGVCTGIIARPLCTVCAPSNILPELARPPPLCAGSADTRAVDSWQNSLRDVGTRQRCVKKCFGQKLPRAS